MGNYWDIQNVNDKKKEIGIIEKKLKNVYVYILV